jgi:cytochrome c biogenesis protein CcmG/thiol:disulfide interchange protein DsbE
MIRFRFATVFAILVAFVPLGAVRAATFPDIGLKTDNGALKLSSLRGKVVYVDYWASWCVPCRRSFPWMNDMQARYKNQGLVIVAISVDADMASAKRFLAKTPANFTVAYDPESVTADALDVPGMPTSFLIDRAGKIVWRHVGFREADKARNEAKIKEQLGR